MIPFFLELIVMLIYIRARLPPSPHLLGVNSEHLSQLQQHVGAASDSIIYILFLSKGISDEERLELMSSVFDLKLASVSPLKEKTIPTDVFLAQLQYSLVLLNNLDELPREFQHKLFENLPNAKIDQTIFMQVMKLIETCSPAFFVLPRQTDPAEIFFQDQLYWKVCLALSSFFVMVPPTCFPSIETVIFQNLTNRIRHLPATLLIIDAWLYVLRTTNKSLLEKHFQILLELALSGVFREENQSKALFMSILRRVLMLFEKNYPMSFWESIGLGNAILPLEKINCDLIDVWKNIPLFHCDERHLSLISKRFIERSIKYTFQIYEENQLGKREMKLSICLLSSLATHLHELKALQKGIGANSYLNQMANAASLQTLLNKSIILFNFSNYLQQVDVLPIVTEGASVLVEFATSLIPTLSFHEVLKVLNILFHWFEGAIINYDENANPTTQKPFSDLQQKVLLSFIPKQLICDFLAGCGVVIIERNQEDKFVRAISGLYGNLLSDTDWKVCELAFESFSTFASRTCHPNLINKLMPDWCYNFFVEFMKKAPIPVELSSSNLASASPEIREIEFCKNLFLQFSKNKIKYLAKLKYQEKGARFEEGERSTFEPANKKVKMDQTLLNEKINSIEAFLDEGNLEETQRNWLIEKLQSLLVKLERK